MVEFPLSHTYTQLFPFDVQHPNASEQLERSKKELLSLLRLVLTALLPYRKSNRVNRRVANMRSI